MGRATARRVDPTHYPETDHMGEGLLHRLIAELLRSLVASWLAQRGVRACVGANQFVYYREHAPTVSVAPDVYVLPGIDPELTFSSWKTWERGVVPSFAFECVSEDWLKDYRDAPPRYDELGTAELVIFDPEHGASPTERVRWQLWRRVARRGLVRVLATNDDRVRSKVLGCWLRAVGEGDRLRARLATGAHGETLLPTDTERTEHEHERAERERDRAEHERDRAEHERDRAEHEHERAERERERAEHEHERAEVAERELARLRAERQAR